jgi:hypothetical protein
MERKMAKGWRIVGVFIFLTVFAVALSAQQAEPVKEFNPLYNPQQVIQRLSYDNFKSIKLLHTAIVNFGGGEAEFERLVNDYAEATSYYFRGSLVESANLFTKNEKDIHAVGMKLAQKFKEDTEALHREVIKQHVKSNVKLSLKGEKADPTAELLVSNGAFGINKANDLFERSKPVDAVYYYRRAKESCFKYYELTKEPLPDRYKKDVVDAQNKIYTSKEKEK